MQHAEEDPSDIFKRVKKVHPGQERQQGKPNNGQQ
jgi:hypothetical protein